MIYYTGVGSRETPDSILALMRTIGATVPQYGIIGRSGNGSKKYVLFDGALGRCAGAPERRLYKREGARTGNSYETVRRMVQRKVKQDEIIRPTSGLYP